MSNTGSQAIDGKMVQAWSDSMHAGNCTPKQRVGKTTQDFEEKGRLHTNHGACSTRTVATARSNAYSKHAGSNRKRLRRILSLYSGYCPFCLFLTCELTQSDISSTMWGIPVLLHPTVVAPHNPPKIGYLECDGWSRITWKGWQLRTWATEENSLGRVLRREGVFAGRE